MFVGQNFQKYLMIESDEGPFNVAQSSREPKILVAWRPKIDGPLLTPPEVTQSNPFLYSRSLAEHSLISILYFKTNKTRQQNLLL